MMVKTKVLHLVFYGCIFLFFGGITGLDGYFHPVFADAQEIAREKEKPAALQTDKKGGKRPPSKAGASSDTDAAGGEIRPAEHAEGSGASRGRQSKDFELI